MREVQTFGLRNGIASIPLIGMDLSWSDLGNIHMRGDYPFRDGTITVTDAEIAIWKQKPDARFQLMRKHPIKDRINYVLGKQIEPHVSRSQLIYESSNGDVWCLTTDPASGARAVMHQPNAQSGGQVSYIDIDEFLRESPVGPQHQALRQLLLPHG